MKITDLNPHGGIGANSWLVELGSFTLVVDAGLSPKENGPGALPRLDLTRDKAVDLVLLTHCHLDHLGAIPVLMRYHPAAMLVMSPPSKLLAKRMLHNSCNVMSRQKAELGIAEYPLYGHQEIERLGERIFPIAYDNPRFFSSRTGEVLTVTYHFAGHIPGAAGITLEYQKRKIFFTGDVLFNAQYILPGAKFPRQPVDTLVMETTRGKQERAGVYSREAEVQRLLGVIRDTYAGGGSVLIPVFALGRMQEVMSILHRGLRSRQIPEAPIYASGLGLDLVDYFDEIDRKTGGVKFRRQVMKDLKVRKLPDKLRPGKAPKERGIFIVSSGMMVENTPSYAVAAMLLNDPRSALCYVGYCDPETPGGVIQRLEPGAEYRFEALEYKAPLRMARHRFDFSGHADREELWQLAVDVDPRAVVLTHGDPEARAWFVERFKQERPRTKVIDPVPLAATEV